MKFRIGPWVYRVRICPGELSEEGAPVDAITHDYVIHICGLLNPRRRLQPLMDQLRRMHEKLYGPLRGEAIGTFTTDMLRQLRTQGDEAALMRLTPDCWIDAGGVEDVGAEPRGCECGQCGTRYGEHQITTGPAELDANLAKMVVRRWCDCEFCGMTMTWTEGATPSGFPNGRVMSGPDYTRLRKGA